jgi:hypothetical protein
LGCVEVEDFESGKLNIQTGIFYICSIDRASGKMQVPLAIPESDQEKDGSKKR